MPPTPDWLLPLLAAPFMGSFLGLLVVRLPAGEGVVRGRSTCRRCGRALGPRDLVPLLSWAWTGGRCRYCGARLGWLYPGIELAAVGVVLWAAAATSGWVLWASCALGWTLLALAAIDLRALLLPDALTLPLVPAGLAAAWLIDPGLLPHHVLGAALGFAVFAAVGWLYSRLRGREGLGPGDAKLLAAAGAWVSWAGLPSVVLLAGLAALAAVVLAGIVPGGGGMPARDRPIAFGAYLALGTWLVWLHGPLVIG